MQKPGHPTEPFCSDVNAEVGALLASVNARAWASNLQVYVPSPSEDLRTVPKIYVPLFRRKSCHDVKMIWEDFPKIFRRSFRRLKSSEGGFPKIFRRSSEDDLGPDPQGEESFRRLFPSSSHVFPRYPTLSSILSLSLNKEFRVPTFSHVFPEQHDPRYFRFL